MSKRLISSGSSFEAVAGYSRAVVDGQYVHVAGTTGFDYARMTIADDALRNATSALPILRKHCARPAARSMTWCGCATT